MTRHVFLLFVGFTGLFLCFFQTESLATPPHVSNSPPQSLDEEYFQMAVHSPESWTNRHYISVFDVRKEEVSAYVLDRINRETMGRPGERYCLDPTVLGKIVLPFNRKEGLSWILEHYGDFTVWARHRVLYGLTNCPSAEALTVLVELLCDKNTFPVTPLDVMRWGKPELHVRVCDYAYCYALVALAQAGMPTPGMPGDMFALQNRMEAQTQSQRDRDIEAFRAWWATNSAAVVKALPKLAEPGSDLERAFESFMVRQPWLRPPAPQSPLESSGGKMPRTETVAAPPHSDNRPSSEGDSATASTRRRWPAIALGGILLVGCVGALFLRRRRSQ